MPKVIIAGGGVHGTFLSHALTRTHTLDVDDITVLDPYAEPLSVWRHQTRNTGMRYMRSPSSHNLDLDFHALRAFARQRAGGGADDGGAGPAGGEPPFIPPYARPTLELFNAHARAVIEHRGLRRMRRRARLLDIDADPGGVRVLTDDGEEGADFLVLAVGRTEQIYRPAWAVAARAGSEGAAAVLHVFDAAFGPELFDGARAPVIVGGGVTAAQVACLAARRSNTRVRLLARGPITVQQFDSEPCFIGPRCLEQFLSAPTPRERRRFIDEARHPGTVPWDVERLLREDTRIEVVEDEIVGVEPAAGGASPAGLPVRIRLSARRAPVESDMVVLATGFHPGPPLAPLLADLSRRHGLATGPAGFPVPDLHLRWHPRVMVTGPLGELELGPAAPNIIGAHLAARRLVPFFRGGVEMEGARLAAREIARTTLTRYLA
jgi:hypothetical protein